MKDLLKLDMRCRRIWGVTLKQSDLKYNFLIEYCYRIIWDNRSKTGAWRDKLKKFYLLDLFNYKY